MRTRPQAWAWVDWRGSVGFTIIEIMIAIAIFSMVLTAIYASWSSILRASKVGAQAADAVQRARIASRTVQDALTCATLFTANVGYYAFEVDTSKDFALMSFVSHLPPSFPGSGYFGDLTVRRVTLGVEQAADGINELRMTQTPLLQSDVREMQPQTIVLAREVSMFAAEFWDTRANEWVGEWRQTNQLPKMVRFSMAFDQLAGRSKRTEKVTTRTVALACSAVQQDWQTPRPGPGGPVPGIPGGGAAGAGGAGAAGAAGAGAATGAGTGVGTKLK